MAKELIFRFKSDFEIEALIDDLEEQLEVKKRPLVEEVGTSLWNEDRTFELRTRPRDKGKFCEVFIRVKTANLEILAKEIFGEPIHERNVSASILDVVELIAELPDNQSQENIREIVKDKFGLEDEKFNAYKMMILKQAKRNNTRYFHRAAEKLS